MINTSVIKETVSFVSDDEDDFDLPSSEVESEAESDSSFIPSNMLMDDIYGTLSPSRRSSRFRKSPCRYKASGSRATSIPESGQ